MKKLNFIEKIFVFVIIPMAIIKMVIDALLGYIKLW